MTPLTPVMLDPVYTLESPKTLLKTPDAWAPLPKSLIQLVWDGAQSIFFLSSPSDSNPNLKTVFQYFSRSPRNLIQIQILIH